MQTCNSSSLRRMLLRGMLTVMFMLLAAGARPGLFAQIVVDDFNTGAFSVSGPSGSANDIPASGAIGEVRDVLISDSGGGSVPSVMSLTPGNGCLNLAVGDSPGSYEIGWGNNYFFGGTDLNLNASSFDRIVVTLSQAPTSGSMSVIFNRLMDADLGVATLSLNGAGDYTFLFTNTVFANVNTSDIDGIEIAFTAGVPAGSTIRVESVTIGAPQRNLSINNASLNEGDAGTTSFDFTVSLDLPAGTGGVTFDIATADGTAQDDNPISEDNDYVAKSLTGQTIPAGSSTYTFSVTVNGDVAVEPDETFFVNVGNVVGATLGDDQGLGTITNDDAPPPVKPFVFLANKVTIKSTKQSTPSGDIHSNGLLTVEKGAPSTYNSNLTAIGKITINKQNTINGNVKSQTSVSNSGKINGTKTIGSVANEPLPSLSYSAGGSNVTVPNGGSLSLAPGSYGIVTMSQGGTLKLSSGEYFMNELRYSSTIEGGTIEIDLSSGDPITINVVSNLQFGHEAAVVLLPNGESDSELVTFNTMQSTAANWGREAYLLGSFNAPNAIVTLVKNSQLRGSICAKEILVSNDCLFLHHDSPGSLPGPGNLPKAFFVDEEEARGEMGEGRVVSYELEQNYPNPFNPTTTISFALPEASEVSLSIFNMSGQLVRKLVAGEMNAGAHSFMWDATNERGERVASGVYLYVITAGEFTAQRKLVLMK